MDKQSLQKGGLNAASGMAFATGTTLVSTQEIVPMIIGTILILAGFGFQAWREYLKSKAE